MKSNLKIVSAIAGLVMLLISLDASSYPIRGKRKFVKDFGSNSGTLYCNNSGTCAEVVGDLIYFGIWVGNWNYGYVRQPNEGEDNNQEYYITNVSEVNE